MQYNTSQDLENSISVSVPETEDLMKYRIRRHIKLGETDVWIAANTEQEYADKLIRLAGFTYQSTDRIRIVRITRSFIFPRFIHSIIWKTKQLGVKQMAAYGTRYIGGPKKLYYFSMRIEYPYWKTVSDIADQIHDIIEAIHRDDDTYVFDDDGALSTILDYVEHEDRYVYYGFVTDRETCKKLEKLRKYWGFQVEKTGGRWI